MSQRRRRDRQRDLDDLRLPKSLAGVDATASVDFSDYEESNRDHANYLYPNELPANLADRCRNECMRLYFNSSPYTNNMLSLWLQQECGRRSTNRFMGALMEWMWDVIRMLSAAYDIRNQTLPGSTRPRPPHPHRNGGRGGPNGPASGGGSSGMSFTNTSCGGFGNIHSDGKLGPKWGRKRSDTEEIGEGDYEIPVQCEKMAELVRQAEQLMSMEGDKEDSEPLTIKDLVMQAMDMQKREEAVTDEKETEVGEKEAEVGEKEAEVVSDSDGNETDAGPAKKAKRAKTAEEEGECSTKSVEVVTTTPPVTPPRNPDARKRQMEVMQLSPKVSDQLKKFGESGEADRTALMQVLQELQSQSTSAEEVYEQLFRAQAAQQILGEMAKEEGKEAAKRIKRKRSDCMSASNSPSPSPVQVLSPVRTAEVH